MARGVSKSLNDHWTSDLPYTGEVLAQAACGKQQATSSKQPVSDNKHHTRDCKQHEQERILHKRQTASSRQQAAHTRLQGAEKQWKYDALCQALRRAFPDYLVVVRDFVVGVRGSVPEDRWGFHLTALGVGRGDQRRILTLAALRHMPQNVSPRLLGRIRRA